MSDLPVICAAVRIFGCDKQIDIAIEEMSELTHALLKARRAGFPCRGKEDPEGYQDHIREEMADVGIVLDQLRFIFGDDGPWRRKKIERLEGRLKDAQDDNCTG